MKVLYISYDPAILAGLSDRVPCDGLLPLLPALELHPLLPAIQLKHVHQHVPQGVQHGQVKTLNLHKYKVQGVQGTKACTSRGLAY